MANQWGGDPNIGVGVIVSTAGPMDAPGSGTLYDLTNHAGVNYVDGDVGIEINRGRSDEFSHFQSGTCTFTLHNNNREFDPARAEVALDVPGTVGATTPDHAAYAPGGDLDFRVRLSMANWVPGGFGSIIASQWQDGVSEGWLLGINPTGFLTFTFTTNGTTDLPRTSTVPTVFTPGSVHWLRFYLDVNNGAAGHDVIFYTSEDGNTWNQLGATVTNAGTVTVFNSTRQIAVSDILPIDGQVYRFQFYNSGALVADADFTAQTPGAMSFTDNTSRVWTLNAAASLGYDDHASVFAPILCPRRLVHVIAGQFDDPSTTRFLFTGYIEGWPQAWTSTTGSVEIICQDLLTILAQTTTTSGTGVFILDHPLQGRLDHGRLAGDLPEQFTGQRVAAMVGLAGLSAQIQSIDTGLTAMSAGEPSGDLLSVCQEAEETEAGFFYVNTQGSVVFLDRHARFQETRLSTLQETFTDSEYSGMTVEYGLAQMWNMARFIRPARDDTDVPLEQIAADEPSIAMHGRRSYPQSGINTLPVLSDAEALARAEFWVDRFGIPQQRPSPVVLKMRRDPDSMFLRLAGRELLDRIALVRTPLNMGTPITFTGLLDQIKHRITKTEWDTTLAISPIDVDDGQTFLVLNHATLGQLDQEQLAY